MQTAICKLPDCKKILKTDGGLTKGLHMNIRVMQTKWKKSFFLVYKGALPQSVPINDNFFFLNFSSIKECLEVATDI